jgi:hypothetical protein
LNVAGERNGGCGIHFSHDVGAVDFDGADAHPQPGGDLLVSEAFHHKRQDLPFAGGEREHICPRFSGSFSFLGYGMLCLLVF